MISCVVVSSIEYLACRSNRCLVVPTRVWSLESSSEEKVKEARYRFSIEYLVGEAMRSLVTLN
jgi:hypothetical protein